MRFRFCWNSFCENRADRAKKAEACQHHNHACNHNAAHHRRNGFSETHSQKACRKSSCPRACSRNWNSHKKHECDKKPVACLGFEFFARGRAFCQKKSAHSANQLFVLPPFQKAARKKINHRHRKHIAYNADDVRRNKRQFPKLRKRNRAAQFDERHHRDEKNCEIF